MEYIKIIKRDGREVPFDINRIETAVHKAYVATRGNENKAYCRSIAEK